MSKLFALPKQVVLTNAGALIPGAKATFYEAGTSTLLDVYTASDLVTAHANPVVADAAGRFPAIYYDPADDYKVVITNASDVELYSEDNVATGTTASTVPIVDTATNFTATDVEAALKEISDDFLKTNRSDTVSVMYTWTAGGINLGDYALTRPYIKDFALVHSAVTSVSGTATLDYEVANSFSITLTENTTIAVANWPATGREGVITVRVTQDGGGGAYTVTLPSGTRIPGGATYTMSTSNDAYDKFTLSTVDAGTNIDFDYSQAYA